MGGVQGPQDASFPFMNFSILSLVNVIEDDPAVAHVNAYTGQGGNGGFIFIALKPLGNSCKEGAKMRCAPDLGHGRDQPPAAQDEPPAGGFRHSCSRRRICASAAAAATRSYQYTIQSDNIADLAHWGPILLEHMKKLPGLQDVNTDQQNGGLEELLTYDRITAARLGQTPQSLDSSLYSAFGQSEVSVIYTQLNQYYVVMEVAPQYWQDPSGLNNIYFTSQASRRPAPRGLNTVSPLFTVVKPQTSTTPLQVNHTGLFPSVTVSFNLAQRRFAQRRHARSQPDGAAAWACRERCTASLPEPRRPISIRWPREPILIITALLSVFIVLGILYESLVHPLTIISTLLSASVGAMLALMLFHIDLNVISIIGIILLIGIVKKNAIMMIDFALQAERAGRQEHARRHLRGLHAALPAHHDDHHVGHLRRAAAGLRNRHRLGAAQTAGHHHRGRAAAEPVAHALHHPGGLPADGPAAPARAGPDARRAARQRPEGAAS